MTAQKIAKSKLVKKKGDGRQRAHRMAGERIAAPLPSAVGGGFRPR